MHPALRTPLCDLLGIEYPIVQAGMGYVARAELCAAVSTAGGLGVIGAASLNAKELREEIHRGSELGRIATLARMWCCATDANCRTA